MPFRSFLSFFLLMASSHAVETTPLREPSAGNTPFTALTPEQTGIHFVSPLVVDHPLSYLYHSGFACGSVALGDVNGDGWPDIFFTNGPGKNALYLQDPNKPLSFSDQAPVLGVGGDNRWGTGSSLLDIDGDGDLDLYVCNYRGKHELYLNQLVPTGKLAFVESAEAWGLAHVNASMTPAFADFDLDGDLDLFMLNNRLERPEGRPTKPPFKMVNGKPQVLREFANYYHVSQKPDGGFGMDSYGQPDRLYKNEGGKFRDVTVGSGIEGIGHGLAAIWWDYNLDGYPDLFVSNDFTDPDRLYRNNQDGTFTEVLSETLPYCSWSSMGAASADFNLDGLPDLLSTDMAATSHFKQKVNMGDMSRHRNLMEHGWPRQMMRNMLFVNTGIHRFKETAFMSGLASTDWTWSVKLGDFDGDGLVDAFLSNGIARNFSDADIPMTQDMLIGKTEFEIYKDTPPMLEKNLAFRNEGGLKFENVSASWGLDALGMSYGAAQGDLDLDGDLDLVVMNLDAEVSLYRNDLRANQRIVIQLEGKESNRAGWGSRVALVSGGRTQTHFLHPTTGFQGCDLAELCFGLGKASLADSVTVDWPSGKQSVLKGLKVGMRYVVKEPEESVIASKPKSAKSQYVEVAAEMGLRYKHQETPFDDYLSQPLLPGKLSQLGPGMAWGDYDGDGDDDVYLGGAAGKPGALYQLRDGRFVKMIGPWLKDKASEDMGSVWFDADADGDLDLFVASGGVEHAQGSEALMDRLYLNQGGQTFVKSVDLLPRDGHSSSVVAATDIDRDGDVDLFIGSRSVPGKYPAMPTSRWLRNDAGSFTRLAWPDQLGLVTGATWVDLNDDGWQDLIVVSEWGAPRILVSEEGKRFSDQSEMAGTSFLLGWWNGVAAGDIDHDGDLDFVATNVGLNTKYGQPTAKKPTLLYYGDMDGTGVPQLIEAKPGDSGILPIRGKSCSSKAMPFLAEKFTSYRAFASESLAGIYSPNSLDAADRFEATEFRSGVFRNESTADGLKFSFEPLPFEAQASPGFGVVIHDANADGHVDISIAGNLYTREPETGLWRGSMGSHLRGDGKGGFEDVDPSESGFVVAGDGKSLARADLNADGVPDLFAVQNNDSVLAFRNEAPQGSFLAVRLLGKGANPSALGASVKVYFRDGSQSRADVMGGGGYLSQSSSECFFGLGKRTPERLEVLWPTGEKSEHPVNESRRLRVEQP